MAIARVASADLGLQFGPGTYSANYTVGSGADRYLVAGFFTGSTDDVSNVTYNGTAMTRLVWDSQNAGLADRRIFLYGLAAPVSGSHALSFAFAVSNAAWAFAVDYTGVNATGQPDATASVGNANVVTTTLTASPTVVAANSWVIALARDSNAAPDTWTNATALQASGGLFMADTNGPVSSGSYSITIANAGATLGALIAASLAPAGGGGGGSTWPGYTAPFGWRRQRAFPKPFTERLFRDQMKHAPILRAA